MTAIPTAPLWWVACAVLLLTAGHVAPASAQSLPYSVATLAVGGGGPASVRDQGALFLNPANLVFDDRGGRVVVSILPVRVAGGGNLVQFGFYNDGFTHGAISESTKHELVERWFGSPDKNAIRYAGVSAGIVPAAVVVRNGLWAFGVSARLRSDNRIGTNRGLVDLALFGLEEERSVPVDGELESMNTVHLSAALSRRIPARRLAVGVAPRLILGTSYALGRLNSTVDVGQDALVHRFDYTLQTAGSFSHDVLDRFEVLGSADPHDGSVQNPFGAVAGRGLGLDLGVTHAWKPNVDVALSLTDLGFVRWNADARRVTPTNREFRFEGLDLDMDRVNREFDGSIGAYFAHVIDSLAEDAYGNVEREDIAFTTGTPAAAHLGGTFYFNRRLGAVSAGTTVPLNRAIGHLSRRPAVYFGMEYRLGRRYGIPLRAGVRAGGAGAFSTAVGLGFHTPFWEFAVAAAATPSSQAAGGGMRLTVGVSLITLRFGR